MAYLEIQVRNKEDYDIIKLHSDYSSDRTLVCSLSPEGVKTLSELHAGILKPHLDEKDEDLLKKGVPMPMASVVGGKIFIENGNLEILSFLDVRSFKFTEMKIINLWKLFGLIKSGVVIPTREFLELMKPISLDSPITDLFSSTGKMQFQGRLFGLGDFRPKDYKEGQELTIKDLGFDVWEPTAKMKLYENLGDMVVQEFYKDSKTLTLTKEGNHRVYTAKFYYCTPTMLRLFEKGRTLNLTSEKSNNRDEDAVLVSPFVIPRGYTMHPRKLLRCSRRVPSELFNAAYSEFLFRNRLEAIYD